MYRNSTYISTREIIYFNMYINSQEPQNTRWNLILFIYPFFYIFQKHFWHAEPKFRFFQLPSKWPPINQTSDSRNSCFFRNIASKKKSRPNFALIFWSFESILSKTAFLLVFYWKICHSETEIADSTLFWIPGRIYTCVYSLCIWNLIHYICVYMYTIFTRKSDVMTVYCIYMVTIC